MVHRDVNVGFDQHKCFDDVYRPEALTPQVRGVIFSLNRDQLTYNIKTMDEAFSKSVAKTRLTVLLFA